MFSGWNDPGPGVTGRAERGDACFGQRSRRTAAGAAAPAGTPGAGAAALGGAARGPAACLVPVTHPGPRETFSFSLCYLCTAERTGGTRSPEETS